ncbi:hypothetical protein SSX86_005543 [Deinandra increscens subsp. villosa]|uniref:Uncharacterized protein n=1 Tax=Deinandra increscens subsp. villosa TaxID=3103831 RepID=A0AAP0DR87_9ASTR
MDRKAAVLTAFICLIVSSVGGQSPSSSPTATPAPPTTTTPPPVASPPATTPPPVSTPPPVATPPPVSTPPPVAAPVSAPPPATPPPVASPPPATPPPVASPPPATPPPVASPPPAPLASPPAPVPVASPAVTPTAAPTPSLSSPPAPPTGAPGPSLSTDLSPAPSAPDVSGAVKMGSMAGSIVIGWAVAYSVWLCLWILVSSIRNHSQDLELAGFVVVGEPDVSYLLEREVRTGASVANEEILGFTKLFIDERILDNISRDNAVVFYALLLLYFLLNVLLRFDPQGKERSETVKQQLVASVTSQTTVTNTPITKADSYLEQHETRMMWRGIQVDLHQDQQQL